MMTIAHRLNTVLHNDKILVLDAGTRSEFDDPKILQKNPDSRLSYLMKELDKEEEEGDKKGEEKKKEDKEE